MLNASIGEWKFFAFGPITSLGVGFFILDEKIVIRQIIGAIIVLVSIIKLVNRK